MSYPFYGEVITGYFRDGNKWQERPSAVFLFADSYTNAMRKIEAYYGEEIVEITYLAPFEETSVPLVEMSPEAGRAFIKDTYDFQVKPNAGDKIVEWDIRDPFPENVPSGTMILAVNKG